MEEISHRAVNCCSPRSCVDVQQLLHIMVVIRLVPNAMLWLFASRINNRIHMEANAHAILSLGSAIVLLVNA